MKDWKNWNAGIEERDEGIWNAGREREIDREREIERERERWSTSSTNMLTYIEWLC